VLQVSDVDRPERNHQHHASGKPVTTTSKQTGGNGQQAGNLDRAPPSEEPWTVPTDADGSVDWTYRPSPLTDASTANFYMNKEEQQAKDQKVVEVIGLATRQEEAKARAEEARLERAKLTNGIALPPMADPAAITLEFARSTDTATIRLEYLVDPFLPARCVVCFSGRGSTAKSSFLASLSAHVSPNASTLWVSVEELSDWIRVRHIKSGGRDGSLAVVAAVAAKKDSQGRVIGSNFNIYEHLEPAVLKTQIGLREGGNAPLRLIVLDTAVGLTNWAKGESPNDDSAVKRLLAYLQALAEKHNLTIAFIHHANKQRMPDHFVDTVAGSSAWTNSPRLSFVHARDRREEHTYVVRVAKSNLTQAFGMSYRTEPIHTLYERLEGADSVLCRVQPDVIVWGEEESMFLYDEATRKPRDDEEGGSCGGQKVSLVERVVETLIEVARTSAGPITRDMIHARLGREIQRREWTKVDEKLRMGAFFYKVAIEAGPQNKALYRLQT